MLFDIKGTLSLSCPGRSGSFQLRKHGGQNGLVLFILGVQWCSPFCWLGWMGELLTLPGKWDGVKEGLNVSVKSQCLSAGWLKRQYIVPANGLPQGIKPLRSVRLPSHIFGFSVSISVCIYSCLEKNSLIPI